MPSETEAGEEDEVDVCTVERIPALCSRYRTNFARSLEGSVLRRIRSRIGFPNTSHCSFAVVTKRMMKIQTLFITFL